MSEQEKAEQLKKQLFYDPYSECPSDGAGCDECDNDGCPQKEMQREDEENQCDYTGEDCIDSECRLFCGCVGCEMITPQTDEQAKIIHEWDEKENCSVQKDDSPLSGKESK